MKFTAAHGIVVVGMIGSLGLTLQGLPDWTGATTPAFWGGLLMQVATTIGAVFVQKPDTGARNRRASDRERRGVVAPPVP